MLVNGEAHGREGMNRRELLVRAGSWMKFSWRRSRESLTDTDDYGSKRRHRRHSIDDDDEDDDDDDENDLCCSVKKNVHFNTEEGNEELVITLMPIADEDSIIYEDDIKIRWFQVRGIDVLVGFPLFDWLLVTTGFHHTFLSSSNSFLATFPSLFTRLVRNVHFRWLTTGLRLCSIREGSYVDFL